MQLAAERHSVREGSTLEYGRGRPTKEWKTGSVFQSPKLVGPLYLGSRPLPEAMPESFDILEKKTNDLKYACLQRIPDGGILRLGTCLRSELSLYHVVNVLSFRLECEHGIASRIVDPVRRYKDAPSIPDVPVAILMEAPSYGSLGDWELRQPGHAAVLCGNADDWTLFGASPDFVLHIDPGLGVATSYYGRLEHQWKDAYRRGNMAQRLALRMVSLGLDVPEHLVSVVGEPALFAPLAITAESEGRWYSVTGSWLVRIALRRCGAIQEDEVRELLNLFPESSEIGKRLRRALRHREPALLSG